MNRSCGDCQLCCELLPVRELDKTNNQRCRYQRRGKKRCSIYAQRPFACEVWSCRWLQDKATAGLSRPDRSHYVIDIMPDYIGCTTPETGRTDLPVIQIWVDPKFPLAHRDLALREYMIAGEHTAIVRYGSHDGFLLIPPQFMSTRQWWERPIMPGDGWETHSAADLLSKGLEISL
jgi:hypothetical protein